MKTFVVRIWTPAEPLVGERDTLRGVVELIGSRRSVAFGDEGELLTFLRGAERAEPEVSLDPSSPTPTTGGER